MRSACSRRCAALAAEVSSRSQFVSFAAKSDSKRSGADKRDMSARHLAVFHPEFLDDLRFWVRNDRRTALRALDIVEATLRDPFTGIGKPEPLKYQLAGAWSRRLTQEHRVVYLVGEGSVDFLQARYHY